MKNNVSNFVTTFAAPAATILGGLFLILWPDAATALLAKAIGWAFLIAGAVMAVSAITQKRGLGAGLWAAGFIAIGGWLIRKPMSLAVAFGKLLGLGLGIGAISGWRKSTSSGGRGVYLAEGVFGLVLLVAPLTATRTVYTILGVVMVAAGVAMLLSRLKNGSRLGPGEDNIIDV